MKWRTQVLAVLMLYFLFLGTVGCHNNAENNLDSAWCYAFKHQGGLSDLGYYYGTNGSVLHFADVNTGSSTVLCSTVGCTHTQSDVCSAKIPGLESMQSSIFCWNEHLYYFVRDSYGTHLYQRDATGNAQVKIGSVLTGYTEKKKTITIKNNAVANGFLYYTAQIQSLVMNNDVGAMQVQREIECIGRMNLKTGKEEILIEEKIDNNLEYITLCAVRNGEVLFTHNGGAEVDKESADYQQDWSQSPVSLKRWNENGEITVVFQKTYQECTKVGMVHDNSIYYTAYKLSNDGQRIYATYAYDLGTNKEIFIANGGVKHLGDKYALVYEDKSGWLGYDLQRKNTLPNDLSKEDIFIRAFSEKGFVFSWLTTNEEDPTGRKESRYYYVGYESLEDGLQETDMVYLYAIQNSA